MWLVLIAVNVPPNLPFFKQLKQAFISMTRKTRHTFQGISKPTRGEDIDAGVTDLNGQRQHRRDLNLNRRPENAYGLQHVDMRLPEDARSKDSRRDNGWVRLDELERGEPA